VPLDDPDASSPVDASAPPPLWIEISAQWW
jgi:hypothetical protein